MNQEEEIIFSFNKIKRIFLKYWYIVLITFVLGAAFVGVKSYKTVAASRAALNTSNSQTGSSGNTAGSAGASGSETANSSGSANGNSLAEDNLSPTGTTYFNISRYVKVDWSEIYPEVNVSNDNSAEDNYYILSRINNQSNYEKDILNDCNNITSFQTFTDAINSALNDNNFTKLTDTDSITLTVSGNDIVIINVYGQCSVERIRCIINAAMDSYVAQGQKLFNLGKCSTIVTNDVMACTKGKDGKFTSLNMTAAKWLENELAKGSSSAIAATDTVNSGSANAANVNISLKSAILTKKNIVVLLGAIVVGLGILCVIAVFDHVLDVPEEAAFTGLDKLGEVSLKDAKAANNSDEAYLLSSRVFTERIATIARDNGYNNIALVTMQANPMIDAMCSNSTNSVSADSNNADSDSAGKFAGMVKFVYPQEYLSKIADIHNCDAAIIAIHSGCDKKTVLRQCVENVNIDSSKVLGFVWIAQ